jgi:hypothetical protein
MSINHSEIEKAFEILQTMPCKECGGEKHHKMSCTQRPFRQLELFKNTCPSIPKKSS